MILDAYLPIEDIIVKMNSFGSRAEKCDASMVWYVEANIRRSDPSPAKVVSA